MSLPPAEDRRLNRRERGDMHNVVDWSVSAKRDESARFTTSGTGETETSLREPYPPGTS